MILRGKIIGRPECGRISWGASRTCDRPGVISRFWQRFQDDDEIPSVGGYHPYVASILTGLESNRACMRYAWPTNCSPSTPSHLSTGTSEDIA
ncbi:nibrin [Trichonephila clavipes]|nr:nibrin [Trichonephila clavipes]